MPHKSCCSYWNTIYSALGILIGVSAFFVFFFVYENQHAGVWGLTSGIFAAVNFHIHFLYLQGRLETWHSVDTLIGLQILGVFVVTVGTAGFVWYIFIAIYEDIPLIPVKDSMYIAAVWAFMTLKWGFSLVVSSCVHVNLYRRENPFFVDTVA